MPAGEPRSEQPTGHSTLQLWTARAMLLVWAPGVLLVLSSLMTGHWAPLPTPRPGDARLQSGLAALRQDSGTGNQAEWTVFHVLYTGCRCSRFVFDYLGERAPIDGAREQVLLVGPPDPDLQRACAERGTPCVRMSQEELETRLGIEAAPLFIVTDPSGQPRYVGGYTDRKQALDYRDAQIVAQLQRGEPVDGLPVFGCGVSDSLQQALDPFGIKY